MGVGRAFALCTVGRFVLFGFALGVLSLLGLSGPLGVVAALVVSSIASLFLLRRQRDLLARALAERTERRTRERAQMRSPLDDVPD